MASHTKAAKEKPKMLGVILKESIVRMGRKKTHVTLSGGVFALHSFLDL